ncbi:MAG: GAF domain-containing protein [Candidatus Sulfotelmatobacter sp.]
MTLQADGLRGAMRWLNDRVPYRFTAIFAFDGDMLRNICLIDKNDRNTTNCSDQPITESYCMYIHRSRETFSVEEALLDKRVAVHPKRQSLQCYYGIPLFNSEGKMLGTVCHFDRMPVRVTEDVVTVLDDLAPSIAAAAFGARENTYRPEPGFIAQGR